MQVQRVIGAGHQRIHIARPERVDLHSLDDAYGGSSRFIFLTDLAKHVANDDESSHHSMLKFTLSFIDKFATEVRHGLIA